jgi:hypothetical protein
MLDHASYKINPFLFVKLSINLISKYYFDIIITLKKNKSTSPISIQCNVAEPIWKEKKRKVQ